MTENVLVGVKKYFIVILLYSILRSKWMAQSGMHEPNWCARVRQAII